VPCSTGVRKARAKARLVLSEYLGFDDQLLIEAVRVERR